ncbi:MAG: neutral/alkaline non-lysosomal ceramidase N-terminal domain-containing protein [Akkermansiaceae bacterium]|nr:neutral/alkaline non-lysosomal ceramidase N-terminal domain-containing protein [Akkermansiaceae bacterium]MCP5551478.1 neutral/alkaline non-lysosomal ceramidase N-terminal domain-containing protein [Akkermansiaceae bacterium]
MKTRLTLPALLSAGLLALTVLILGAANPEPPFGATPEPPPQPPKPLAPHVPVTWKAGFARATITPEKLIWMSGYAARKKPAEGKVQDLFAKAMALEDETGGRFVFVTLDLIGVPQGLRWRVAKRAEEQFQLPPERLLLNASHTHSGPEPWRRAEPPTEEQLESQKTRDSWEYTRDLEEKMVAIIGDAIGRLEAARITFGHARCGFAMNRRRDYSLPEGHPNANKAPNPDGPVDHAVPALRIEAPDGALKGVLFGYACHNTSLGFQNYCGDYAGYAQEYLEANREGFQAMFLMGCAGDQNPYPRRSGVVPGVTDLELAMQHGRSLANAVEMALTVNPRGVGGGIVAGYEEIDLVYADPKKPNHPYPVQVVRFGKDVTLVALGSEVVVDYSLRFKKELAGEADVWVAAYSNDYTGYVPSLRVLKEGGYEAAAGHAEDVEDRIASKVRDLYEKTARP